MPEAEEIVNGLQAIVNDYSIFAIVWHVAFYALLIALLSKWVPSNRLLGGLAAVKGVPALPRAVCRLT